MPRRSRNSVRVASGCSRTRARRRPTASASSLGGGSAAVGLGLDGAGGTPSLQEPDEEGEVDGEEVGDMAERVFAAINGGDEAFPEIDGVRTHESTSLGAAPPKSFYSACYPCANRSRRCDKHAS